MPRGGSTSSSRVTDVEDFVDTLQRIAKGASVADPALVQELVSAQRRDDPLAALSVRERGARLAEGPDREVDVFPGRANVKRCSAGRLGMRMPSGHRLQSCQSISGPLHAGRYARIPVGGQR